jgi:succinoglycan biosynthesis protein ExoA
MIAPGLSASIILTVRNEAAHIARCLDSLLALDLGGIDHEILIVDGMSEDGTREIVARFQNKKCKTKIANCTHKIKLLDNPKKGVAAGRNIGIRNAKGGVLVMMDAHARYAPDYVKRCWEVMDKTGSANVGGPAVALPGGDSAMAGAIALAHHSPFGLGGGRFRDAAAEGFVETVWPGCFRKAVFDTTGYIDERRSRTEDLEFNTRLRAAGFAIYLSPTIKAWYYCRTTLGETWRQRWADGFEITYFLPDNPAAPQLRHYVPLAFVAGLVLFSAAAIFSPGARPLMAALLSAELAAYLAASLFSTARAATWAQQRATNNGQPATAQSIVLLPLVFAALHISYGLGSLWGLLAQPWRPNPKTGYNHE